MILKSRFGTVLRRDLPQDAGVALPPTGPVFRARSYEQKVEVVQCVLGALFPGQDVKVRARNKENRSVISGFWVWSMTNLKHEYVSRDKIFDRNSGRDPKTYRKQVRHRILRWRDFCKEYEKLMGQAVVQ